MIWQIGSRHRVAIGDSHDPALVAELLDGADIGASVFDPDWDRLPDTLPPGVDTRDVLLFTGPAWLDQALRLWPSRRIAHVFVWNCVALQYRPGRPLAGHKLCLWLGDPARYLNASRYRTPTSNARRLGDRYDERIADVVRVGRHKHAKPYDWVRCLLDNCTSGTVYDPYLGSGTTLWACEFLGRSCIGVEKNPELIETAKSRGFTCKPCSS